MTIWTIINSKTNIKTEVSLIIPANEGYEDNDVGFKKFIGDTFHDEFMFGNKSEIKIESLGKEIFAEIGGSSGEVVGHNEINEIAQNIIIYKDLPKELLEQKIKLNEEKLIELEKEGAELTLDSYQKNKNPYSYYGISKKAF